MRTRPARLAAAVLVASFVALTLYLAPALVTVMMSRLGFQRAEPGYAGAALAGAIGMRFGAVRPFAMAVVALAGAAVILWQRPGWIAYQAASCSVLLGWTFGVPFLFGGVAHVDANGRLTTAINIIVGTGLAAGPALAALLVGASGHYRRVVVLALGLMLASYLLARPMLRAGARRAT